MFELFLIVWKTMDSTQQAKIPRSTILMDKATLPSYLKVMRIVLTVYLHQFQESLLVDLGMEQP